MNPVNDNLVEATRYAVLRRLAPAIRHGIVGKLHPLSLSSDVLERRLKAPAPDLAAIRENANQIKGSARTAMRSCTSLLAWLTQEEDTLVRLGEGVAECLELLKTDFGMRGFEFEDHAHESPVEVYRSALCSVLAASLLAATDAASGPADLVITARESTLTILMRPAERTAAMAAGAAYRSLAWREVEALAVAESVELSRQGDRITLRCRSADSPGAPAPSFRPAARPIR